jgi:hypothetical protein
VVLDEREHLAGQGQQVVEAGDLVAVEQAAVAVGDALPLGPELVQRPGQVLAPLDPADVVGQRRERRAQVVDPGPLGVAVAGTGGVVEPWVLDRFQVGQPTPSSTARAASRRSSASGRYRITSMPATIRATRSSVMAGK